MGGLGVKEAPMAIVPFASDYWRHIQLHQVLTSRPKPEHDLDLYARSTAEPAQIRRYSWDTHVLLSHPHGSEASLYSRTRHVF